MDEDACQMSHETLSQSLYQALELPGCSIEKRNLQKKCITDTEIITSLFYGHFWGPRSCYIFGSQYEGTSMPDMGSDLDQVTVFEDLEVVSNLQDCPEKCLLLIQDEFTPHGYCKLQTVLHNVPVRSSLCSNNPALLSKFQNHETFQFGVDMYGRLLLCNSFIEHIQFPSKTGFHGPAMQMVDVKSRRMNADFVIAFRCRCFPKDALKWVTRKRLYGWPPKEAIEKCKNLGFFVVPVGHPNSIEKDKEWRISLSLQERLLVTLFNSVQLKCFVLMKVLKNEVINKKLNKKVLTSYHCKTCMLYMIEKTPINFWVPVNLLTCVTACLKKLYEWTLENNCPNYFIPEENMFDKLESRDLQQLANILQTLLSSNDLMIVLLSLRTCYIGQCLRDQMFLDNRMQSLINDTEVNASQRLQEVEILRDGLTSVAYRAKAWQNFSQCEFIHELLTLRCILLRDSYTRDLTVEKNVRSIVNTLDSATKVTEHSEKETKSAVDAFLPFIKPTLMSLEISLLERAGTPIKEIMESLKEENRSTDSFQLKKSCILYVLGYHQDSINALQSIPMGVRFSFCRCGIMAKPVPDNYRFIIEFLLCRSDIFGKNVTTKDLLWKVISPCVPFLPTEASVTPSIVIYECLRCFCLPTNPSEVIPKFIYQHEVAYVDGVFLYAFLLYLNHSKMQQRDLTCIDILLMNAVVNTREVSHKASCLNILGWVFKRESLKSNALECFIRSIREEKELNAAYWHLLFWMCE